MNLVPILTGDTRPTCGLDEIHSPLVMYFEGQPIRVVIRPHLPIELTMAWVLVDVATALGFSKPSDAGSTILNEGSEVDSNLIGGNKGSRKAKVLTFAGLAKLLMRSDKGTARRFQDWLASKSSDLTFHGVAFRDTDVQTGMGAAGYVTAAAEMTAEFNARMEPLTQAVAALTSAVNGMLANHARQDSLLAKLDSTMSGVRPVVYSAKDPKSLLHRLDAQAKRRLHDDGFARVEEYLCSILNVAKPPRTEVNRLAQRARCYCENHGYTISRWLSRGRTVNYYPWQHIDAAYRARDIKQQGDLFADVIDLDAKRAERAEGEKGA